MKARKWTQKELALLGTMPDKELAVRLGITSESVRLHRTQRGISSFRASNRLKKWTKKHEALLGTMPDGEVARIVGIPKYRVAERRQALGIATWRRKDASGVIAIDAAKIKARREALGVNRFQLAGHNTALAAHLGMLEAGTVRGVRAKTLEKLCELLRCEPEAIRADE
jgi:DNA-binding Xre family transcriptional regulator